MKAFNGREFLRDTYGKSKRHEIVLEDDESFFHHADKTETIWCSIETEEANKIIEFISKAQILGIDNKSINTANEFRDLLKGMVR